jgi:outer membrane protein
MKKMNRLCLLILGLFLVMSVGKVATAGPNIKIAFVDLRRALNGTTEGQTAMGKLTKLKTKLQTKIAGEEKRILKMKVGLEKQANVLTKEAMQKKVEEYYRSVSELQQAYGKFQQELGTKEAKLTQGILLRMQTILAEIGNKEQYTMIYDRSSGAVVWAMSNLDLTDQLIQEYNKRHPGKKSKKSKKKKKKKK